MARRAVTGVTARNGPCAPCGRPRGRACPRCGVRRPARRRAATRCGCCRGRRRRGAEERGDAARVLEECRASAGRRAAGQDVAGRRRAEQLAGQRQGVVQRGARAGGAGLLDDMVPVEASPVAADAARRRRTGGAGAAASARGGSPGAAACPRARASRPRVAVQPCRRRGAPTAAVARAEEARRPQRPVQLEAHLAACAGRKYCGSWYGWCSAAKVGAARVGIAERRAALARRR